MVSFSNLDGTSFQKINPGGIRAIWVILARDISNSWPSNKDIVDGVVTTAPVLNPGKCFVQYQSPDSTTDISGSSVGEAGYNSFKHSVGISFAGFSPIHVAELSKLNNAGIVIIGLQNDGNYVIAGQSRTPIFLKSDLKIGKKGSDKRGFDLKGEQDGYSWDITPVNNNVIPLLQQPRLFGLGWTYQFN
jgi:hypothetical protein